MKVVVFKDRASDWRWRYVAENGEAIADSGEGYKLKGYAKRKAKELFPNAELVIEDSAN